MMRPPQIILVNDTGSELDVFVTVGIRGRYWLSRKIINNKISNNKSESMSIQIENLQLGNSKLKRGNLVEYFRQKLST